MLRYYPQYCLSAFVATAILFVMYFMKRNFRTRKNRIFLIMLTDNLLASGINITTFYVISFPERYPLWADYLSNLVYLSIYNLMAVLFLLYVDSATKIPHMKLPVRIIAGIIACYDLLIIWTTPFTHLVSYFDEELNYRHGPLMVSLYVTAFIAVFTANIMFLRMRKSFNSYQVFSITCFVFGIFGSVMFQAFHPKHVISNFACAMALFFLYTAFENQAYYLYGDTPCYNKKAFIRTIHRMKKLEKPYGVLAVKIEEFENCIHALGRVGAEQLPERIAERISLEFGKMAYCIDGDTFALVAEEDLRGELLAQRLENCFGEPFMLKVEDRVLTAKIKPVMTWIPVSSVDIEGFEMAEVLQGLDDSISDGLMVVDDAWKWIQPVRREKEVLAILDRAIRNQSFEVYYQPIHEVMSGKFLCAEALVRLKDDNGKFISPEEFIPIAEKNGRISDIGNFVFREVCRFISESELIEHGVSYIELNLSPAQCRQRDLAEQFLKVMEEYHIAPHRINLEITETAEMQSLGMSKLHEIMKTLHDHGVTFSLDDFGSGFAALNYLISLPVDIVKIDKSILWQAMKDEKSKTILKHTMIMIKEIGKSIVVEGVETEEMAEILRNFGCDYMQGYLYSKPITGKEYLEFLKREKNSGLSVKRSRKP